MVNITENHYRWDFVGLSTDSKPTPATSQKVVNGSTYYEADTSKLFVYYGDSWYEKTSKLDSYSSETWTFTLEDDSVVTKKVVIEAQSEE